MGLRVLFALPGLHLVQRGAEVAMEATADEMARMPGFSVTVMGAGREIPGRAYRFRHVPCTHRTRFERWPRLPVFRGEYTWEEFTFVARLWRAYRPDRFDVTITCGYPFLNWFFRARRSGGRRPAHIFATHIGDWPPRALNSEYRLFGCDGLACINPEHVERHRERWDARLLPNGVDAGRFRPGPARRARFGLPDDAKVALTVSALKPSKRVLDGIRAAAAVPGLHLVVAGDGPQRDEAEELAARLMPGRFRRMMVPHGEMADLYRSADVYLHMSRDEPFGIVYLEALATGLPIVAHDRDLTRWIVEDQAVLVDTSDLDAVSAGLGRAIGEDTAARRKTRRDLVERRFTWGAVAEGYGELCREVVESRRRSAEKVMEAT